MALFLILIIVLVLAVLYWWRAKAGKYGRMDSGRPTTPSTRA